MDRTQQQERAEHFRSLHAGPRILVLPNAWDVASARVIEEAGAAAIATSSAGVAGVYGYADGQHVGREQMAAMVARIAAAVRVPVTADMEAGYGESLEAVAETVRAVVTAGAIGMNLEDGTHDPARPVRPLSVQVERVRAARKAATEAGVPLVLNARVDVYLASAGEPEERFGEAVKRANAYREAGADCLFIPGVRDAATIGALAREIRGPINVLAGPGFPSVPELEQLGVRRVSLGSGTMRAALGVARRVAQEVLGPGTYSTLEDAVPYAEVNRMLSQSQPREE